MAEDTTATDYANFFEFNTYAQTSTAITTSVTTVTAKPLYTASALQVVAFVVTAAASNGGNIHLGGYNVTSSVAGIVLDAGESYYSPAIAYISDAGTGKYDLNRIYMASDSSANVCYITATVIRENSNNPTP